MSTPAVVVVGSANIDLIVRAPYIPAAGETVLGGDLTIAAGGKGANQAVAAARLGGRVTFVARVGDDAFGRNAVAGYRAEGINTEFVARDASRPTGAALIVVDPKGQNSIAVAPGANAALTAEDVDRAAERIRAADVLLLQLEIPLDTVSHAARSAADAGVRVILNPAPAVSIPDELLRMVSVLTPNETEARVLSDVDVRDVASAREAARVLRERGARAVIVTLGAAGCFVSDPYDQQIAAPVVNAVDATAAGDAFTAALACALAERRDLLDAIRFATTAGAITATRAGAQPSLPTRREVDEWLAARRV